LKEKPCSDPFFLFFVKEKGSFRVFHELFFSLFSFGDIEIMAISKI